MAPRFAWALAGLLLACEAPIHGSLALSPAVVTDAGLEGPGLESDAARGVADASLPLDAGAQDAGAPVPDAGHPDAAPPAPICGDGVCAPGEVCPEDCEAGDWPEDWAAREAEMLVLVNGLRAEGAVCGGRTMPPVAPVLMNAELRTAARDHSADMAEQNYFDHQSLDGRDPWTRIRQAGYGGQGVGENIAAGNAGADATFRQWVNSAGHCRNMMSASPNELGVGYAQGPGRFRHYWTQAFGRR